MHLCATLEREQRDTKTELHLQFLILSHANPLSSSFSNPRRSALIFGKFDFSHATTTHTLCCSLHEKIINKATALTLGLVLNIKTSSSERGEFYCQREIFLMSFRNNVEEIMNSIQRTTTRLICASLAFSESFVLTLWVRRNACGE
jgi:hypothetical protein